MLSTWQPSTVSITPLTSLVPYDYRSPTNNKIVPTPIINLVLKIYFLQDYISINGKLLLFIGNKDWTEVHTFTLNRMVLEMMDSVSYEILLLSMKLI